MIGRLPGNWAPQPGDVGWWDGHVCMYAFNKGGEDWVYNASKKANRFQLQELKWISQDLGKDPVWYRLRWTY